MAIPFASQHTPSFPEALQQLGVSLVVSTYQAGQLILLRPQGTLLNTHFCPLEKPMGLAAQEQRLAVGTAYQLLEYRNLPAVAPKIEGTELHDACYLPRSVQVTGDIDIHEMAYVENGELWLVNTRMSCLCTLDPAYSVVPRWRPPFITGYDLTDRCHLNGLALRDGQPAYVTALGTNDTAGGWRADKAHGGVVMGVPDGRIVAAGLSMPHSPRWHQGQLWVLESGAGALVRIDPATGKKTLVAELPGFTRGLDFAGRYAFIGLSQVRETAVFAGLPLTARVAERQCGVWLVDTETGQTLAFVVFTGSVREVFAVQLLPHRFPAVLEMSDPLVRCSYALPDEALADVAATDPVTEALAEAAARHRAQQFEAAITGYRQVLATRPDEFAARHQLGVALAASGELEAAEVELRRAVALQPTQADAWNHLGLCCASQGHWLEALACYDTALQADRQYPAAHVNRAHALLKLGRYREGWKEWEWHLQLPEFAVAGPQPHWDGEPIPDRVLLVHTDLADRDTLQLVRFLPLAANRCGKLLLACSDTLRPLLVGIDGVAEARLHGAVAADSFDVQCPLASLPAALGVMLNDLPPPPYLAVPGYVNVPPLEAPGLRKIGLCWGGSNTNGNRSDSGFPRPEAWASLLAVSGCRFFSFNAPPARDEAEWFHANGIVDLEPELTDYARAAALIHQLDLVISTDTAIAHLAGALGHPLWVVLGPDADWRWLHERDDSPWYPSARLFIQSDRNGQEALLARTGRALSDFSG